MTTEVFKSWSDYKGKLLEGLDERKAKMVDTMMENVHIDNLKNVNDGTNKVILESTSAGSTTTGHISRYDMLFMPLIRRTMPALLAMDLVGVQPLQGPQGIARTLRFRYGEDATPTVTAGDEASGVNVYEKYSKLARTGDYADTDSLNNFEQTEYLEGDIGKPMRLDVVTQTVDTYSRKLSAAFSLEAADDLQALDNLDIEAELSLTLGDEIRRELDRELLTKLNGLAGATTALDFQLVDGRYAGEKLSALTIALDNLSAEIAVATKKAGATWMVVSQRVFTGLKNAANSTFVPANGGDLQVSNTAFVGTFGTNVKVFVDVYAETDYALLGYKGASEIDTGLVYNPYIPLSSSGVMTNPETGDKRLMLRTRYAMTEFVDDNTSLANSADYYSRANISNIQLGFKNS